MEETQTALPAAPKVAEVSGQPAIDALTDANRAIDQDDTAGEPAAGEKPAAEQKPEKTPEQREIERLRRGIDRKHRQLAEARAQLSLTPRQQEAHNREAADDSEPLSLTRAQLDELVKARLETSRQQEAETERRRGVVKGLTKAWGQDRFDELSESLDTAFDGLVDARKAPKPAVEAIFEADDPAKVIEYLADPEHDDEAEAISRMNAAQAGKAIAKLEAKLQSEVAKAKPQASKAPAPLEAIKGQGPATKAPGNMTDAEYAKWRKSAAH